MTRHTGLCSRQCLVCQWEASAGVDVGLQGTPDKRLGSLTHPVRAQMGTTPGRTCSNSSRTSASPWIILAGKLPLRSDYISLPHLYPHPCAGPTLLGLVADTLHTRSVYSSQVVLAVRLTDLFPVKSRLRQCKWTHGQVRYQEALSGGPCRTRIRCPCASNGRGRPRTSARRRRSR